MFCSKNVSRANPQIDLISLSLMQKLTLALPFFASIKRSITLSISISLRYAARYKDVDEQTLLLRLLDKFKMLLGRVPLNDPIRGMVPKLAPASVDPRE